MLWVEASAIVVSAGSDGAGRGRRLRLRAGVLVQRSPLAAARAVLCPCFTWKQAGVSGRRTMGQEDTPCSRDV